MYYYRIDITLATAVDKDAAKELDKRFQLKLEDGKGVQDLVIDEAYSLLEKHFERALRQTDFGNGRYVRNPVEQAIKRQASRLLTLDPDDVTTEGV
jgi:hypothetical protein